MSRLRQSGVMLRRGGLAYRSSGEGQRLSTSLAEGENMVESRIQEMRSEYPATGRGQLERSGAGCAVIT
jgi:hypothetical protein